MVTASQNIKNVSSESPFFYYDKNIIKNKYKLPGSSFALDSFTLMLLGFKNKRFKEISNVAFKLIKQLNHKKLDNFTKSQFLLEAFKKLGPTFIKIGQFLSTRRDLFPEEYINALSYLQDSVDQLPFYQIKALIEREFQKPLNEIFTSFEELPIAAASIGQVHKARLLNTSIDVAVKVQRPNLNALFYEDLAVLRCIISYLERHTELGKDRQWTEIVDEIGKTLFEEIDFIQEGKNADHFRENLKYNDKVHIPKVFWQFTTRKIITIEYIPGIKITDIKTLENNHINPKMLSVTLVNAYFKQFFEDGFYHADPHPGNIVVKDDGTIVFYDFGMVGRINENVKIELANVLISIIGNDTDTLLKTLKKLELIKSETDLKPIKRIIEQAAFSYYDGAKLDSLDLQNIEADLKKVFDEKPMRLPSKFTYTLRATGTLEGICRTLDPEFSLIACAKPYFYNWIRDNSETNRWQYIKALFPKQKKTIDKMQIYLGVMKELPKYVSMKEAGEATIPIIPTKDKKPNESKNISLKIEVEETKSKLNLAYEVIFLLSIAYSGSFLLDRGNSILNMFGLVLLSFSFLLSVGIVGLSIFKRKMLK